MYVNACLYDHICRRKYARASVDCGLKQNIIYLANYRTSVHARPGLPYIYTYIADMVKITNSNSRLDLARLASSPG